MHYVIIRDDDTNALTPEECLEQLYRPFLDRNLPVNLATIPRVRTDATRANGMPEGFLLDRVSARSVPIRENAMLLHYLHDNPGYHIVQHGYFHTLNEFRSQSVDDVQHRLTRGTEELAAVGFSTPQTFVAPYDEYSALSLREITKRFRVFSTGWFSFKRLPITWWPRYAFNRMLRRRHWRIGQTLLLTHPGCLLSNQRPYPAMLENIRRTVESQNLTVLVTHWWEYFRDHRPDKAFIDVLHQTADYLSSQPDVRVISFDDLANRKVAAL